MSNELKDISNKIDNFFVDVFERVNTAAGALTIKFFVIGATAKLILVKYYYEKKISLRSTQDIDFGIMIDNWDRFKDLKKLLISEFGFNETKIEHRIILNGTLVDIVPFGSIVDSDNKITWPNTENVFSVMGFEEVYENSIPIKIKANPEIVINFTSMAGLAVLKIIAWHDTFPERKKDAEDLLIIIQNYADFDNTERLYTEEITIFDHEDIDYWKASAQLLGRDIRKMVHANTLERMLLVLDESNDIYDYLVQHMLSNRYDDSKIEEVKKLLHHLVLGLKEPIT